MFSACKPADCVLLFSAFQPTSKTQTTKTAMEKKNGSENFEANAIKLGKNLLRPTKK